MRVFRFLVLIALTVSFFSTFAWAQSKAHYPIGEVIELEGKAYYVSPDRHKKKIKVDDPIYLNSVIHTDPDSKILILFIDDTQITLAENSELLIDKYVFDPYDPEENEADFLITKGTFHWLSGMVSKRERPQVKIRTSVGSVDIRGTQFWAGSIDGGYGVLVSDGLVSFEGDWGSAEIPAGKGIFIPGTKTPDAVKIWPKAKEQRALITTTFKRTEQIAERISEARRANVIKRHDYRGQMFPYKSNPYPPGYRPNPDDFFTDEFQELRDGK